MYSLFVGNIDSNSKDENIIDLFGPYGKITIVERKPEEVVVGFSDLKNAKEAFRGMQGELFNEAPLELHWPETSFRSSLINWDRRYTTHIRTDRQSYKPGESVHIRCTILNTFDQTPVDLDEMSKCNLLCSIHGPNGELKFGGGELQMEGPRNGILAFTFPIKEESTGGEHEIRLSMKLYDNPFKKIEDLSKNTFSGLFQISNPHLIEVNDGIVKHIGETPENRTYSYFSFPIYTKKDFSIIVFVDKNENLLPSSLQFGIGNEGIYHHNNAANTTFSTYNCTRPKDWVRNRNGYPEQGSTYEFRGYAEKDTIDVFCDGKMYSKLKRRISQFPTARFFVFFCESGQQVTFMNGFPEVLITSLGTRKFDVETTRKQSKYSKRITFRKQGYGAQDKVISFVKITRSEGGIPPILHIEAKVVLDGNIILDEKYTTNNGLQKIEFNLPENIIETKSTLSCTVREPSGVIENVSKTIPILAKSIDIKFYPESGELVERVLNGVYFQVRSKIGEVVDFTGVLIEKSKEEEEEELKPLQVVSTKHEGRGFFKFVPIAGKEYFIRVIDPSSVTLPCYLPKAKESGCSLRYSIIKTNETTEEIEETEGEDDDDEKKKKNEEEDLDESIIQVEVTSNEKMRVKVVLFRKELIVYETPVLMMNELENRIVKLQNFDDLKGVLRLTVFFVHPVLGITDLNFPIAERLIFVPPKRRIQFDVKTAKKVYSPGDEVELVVKPYFEDDCDRKTIPCHVCVTCTNNSEFEMIEKRRRNPVLEEMVYLETEVNEFHDCSSYLFKKDETEKDDIIVKKPPPEVCCDLLLGVQGWRRYIYNVTKNDILAFTKDEKFKDIPKELFFKLLGIPDVLSLLKKKKPPSRGHRFPPPLGRGRPPPSLPYRGLPSRGPPPRGPPPRSGPPPKGPPPSRGPPPRAAPPPRSRASPPRGPPPKASPPKRGPPPRGPPQRSQAPRPPPGRKPASSARSSLPSRPSPPSKQRSKPPQPPRRPERSEEQRERESERRRKKAEEESRKRREVEERRRMESTVRAEEESRRREEERMYRRREEEERRRVELEYRKRLEEERRKLIEEEKRRRMREQMMKMFQYVKEYAHVSKTKPGGERKDFTSTVYFCSEKMTTKQEKEGNIATFKFSLSDSITSFRVFIDGFDVNGFIGSSSSKLIRSVKPFSVDLKLPLEMTYTDKPRIPIGIFNNLDQKGNVELAISSSHPKVSFSDNKRKIEVIEARERRVEYVELSVASMLDPKTSVVVPEKEKARVSLNGVFQFGGKKLLDSVTKETELVRYGFDQDQSISGVLSEEFPTHKCIIKLPDDYIDFSISTKSHLSPKPITLMLNSINSLICIPSGCFEQVCARLYPMTVALQILELHNLQLSENLVSRMNQGLKAGYDKIRGYEVRHPDGTSGGFDWYGGSRANETLTALGINQLLSMKGVYAAVEEALMERAFKWLMSRKDQKNGGFLKGSGRYSYGYASRDICNAYILWALSKMKMDDRFEGKIKEEDFDEKTISSLLERFGPEKDSNAADCYISSLISMVYFNIGKKDDALKIVKGMLNKYFDGEVGVCLQSKSTITRSGGTSLRLETTSLLCLACLKFKKMFKEEVFKMIGYILSNNRNGRFGSTQATVLCLEALVMYFGELAQPGEAKIGMKINGKDCKISDNDGGILVPVPTTGRTFALPDFSGHFGTSASKAVELELYTENLTYTLPFSVNVFYKVEKPHTDPSKASFEFGQRLSKTEIKEGENVELEVLIRNKSVEETLGMMIARINIPSGLEPRIKSIKEMKENEKFSYYELIGARSICFYWIGMGEGEEIKFKFDVSAVIPGEYIGSPSEAYLYYNEEEKVYLDGLKVKIV